MPRRPVLSRVVALTVGAALAAGTLAGAQAATAPDDPHGSSGIGDPYFPLDGNGGIDVLRYDVHDRYQFDARRLSGRTKVTLRATEALSGFNLDFLLPVRSVTVRGEAVRFDQDVRHELAIDHAVDAGEVVPLVVRYAGRPSQHGYRGERNWLADGHEVIAMNQPHMAPWWFPSNDHPLDRAHLRVSITVPKGKQVISNGHRSARRVDGRLATTTWEAREPMVPYLAFFAAGRFRVAEGRDHGTPWVVAVSKRLPGATQTSGLTLLKRSAAILAWIEDALDAPYPFSTTGGIVTALQPGFALENQTRPTYDRFGLNPSTVVHELAHQWFGDSVAVEGWADIWLNEGPATFFEAYYDEQHGGPTARQWLRRTYDGIPGSSDLWAHEVADPCPAPSGCFSVDDLFAGHVYLRGGMALQALRNVIGSGDFFTLLGRWVTEREGGNGSTADFEALAEDVSGTDLTDFFDAWLHTPAKPADTAANGLG